MRAKSTEHQTCFQVQWILLHPTPTATPMLARPTNETLHFVQAIMQKVKNFMRWDINPTPDKATYNLPSPLPPYFHILGGGQNTDVTNLAKKRPWCACAAIKTEKSGRQERQSEMVRNASVKQIQTKMIAISMPCKWPHIAKILHWPSNITPLRNSWL